VAGTRPGGTGRRQPPVDRHVALGRLRVGLLGIGLLVLVVGVVVTRLRSAPAAGTPPPARKAADVLRSAATPGAPGGGASKTERLTVKVLAVEPHDPTGFIQGLVWDKGLLYESDGLYMASSLREVEESTGKILRRVNVPAGFFAEGLALVGDRLIQLTWKEGTAFVYSRKQFERIDELHYTGEGWGLCYDGRRLVMTDGSDHLSFRDPNTMAVTGTVAVQLDGAPLDQLNALACVDDVVYANVWQTDQIVRIDPMTGRVTAVIDASGLLSPEERGHADVLNGIVWDPQHKRFLITGKLWPKLFAVVFVKQQP
jgi:glutamine cyclotransferase